MPNEEYTPELCPICKMDTEGDMRHVGVECFYQVSEYAPMVTLKEVLRPIPLESKGTWGGSTRYSNGVKTEMYVAGQTISEGGHPVTNLADREVPADEPEIRVIKQTLYSHDCCKACRHEFLLTFRKWIDGDFIDKRRVETGDTGRCRSATTTEIIEMMLDRGADADEIAKFLVELRDNSGTVPVMRGPNRP